jgi:DNA (cytosine-5)-methyltransferase 1
MSQFSTREALQNIDKLPRPRALDLYSGAGGAGFGLLQAGFKTVVGVDIKPQPRYTHARGMHFLQGDATKVPPSFINKFDFVWASPPCQFASGIVTKAQREQFQEKWQKEGRHINLINKTRKVLQAAARPYIIENVVGAKAHLRDPIRLCGTMFPEKDLRVFRMRLFEAGGLPVKLKQPMNACSKVGYALGDRAPKDVIIRPRTEKLRAGATPRMPKGFEAKPVEFPSRNGERIDHIYIPLTEQRKHQVRNMFDRTYCRSVKEAMRASGDLIPMTENEKQADLKRYDEEIKGLRAREKRVNPTGAPAKEMFPVYGDGKRRGTTEEWRAALGIPWMERGELRESIPPAYSEYLGRQVLQAVRNKRQN